MKLFLTICRFPLLAIAMASLLTALWAGLGRLGWGSPFHSSTLMAVHGPLMVGSFLGTLIGVERAVALGTYWPYLAPLSTGLSALAMFLGLPAAPLLLAGSLALVVVCGVVVQRQPDLANVVTAGGALLWVVGNVGWLAGWPLPYVVPWWSGFLIVTIAGERLELSRILRLSAAQRGAFVLAVGVIGVGLEMSTIDFDRGVRVFGLGVMVQSWWLLRYDMARRTVKQHGVTRFIAVCLLSGYGWLGFGGLLTCYGGGVFAGGYYDAMLHAIFVGFIMAMIFGHALIVFPAVLGRPVTFHPWFYVPLLGLHLSLGLRLVGDLAAWLPGRLWSGLFNALMILSFFGLLGGTVWWERNKRAAIPPLS
jgi:hypothetical protein